MKQTEITEKEMNQAMEEMECWLVQNHLRKCKKCKALILKEVEKTCEEERKKEGKRILREIFNYKCGAETNLVDKKAPFGKFLSSLINQRLVLKKGKQI